MRKLLSLLVVILSVMVIGGSVAQSTRTTLDLRTGPIINSGDVSNLALALSVEFPTVGAAYKSRGTSSYITTKKYVGYYNSNTCYRYKGTSADGYFEPAGSTNASYYCNLTGTGTGWSGNLMNFLNTSSVDVLRLALTGGDRFVDESSASVTTPRTILQRAILPSDASASGGSRNTNFYAGGTNYNSNWDAVTLNAGTLTAALTPFGSSKNVVVKACDDKIFFGDTNTGSCAAPGNNANLAIASSSAPSTTVTGVFKARVLVCDSTEGLARTDLCKQQSDGFYKPVGEIQKNADKVRVAAFGYLIDSASWGTASEGSRYGGVLRAPMKFVGLNQKSSVGVVSTNPTPEWDASTGVFLVKPLNTATEAGFTTTGVINYINKFGRLTRDDGVGIDVYKRRDPVGELYYETIRYFQGQQPTSSAVSGTTTALLAGYPAYTTWSDPMQTSCQRNYTMVIGDNNTSKDANLPGSTLSGQTRAADSVTVGSTTVSLNADTWTRVVSSFETNGSTTYVDAQGVTRTANGNGSSSTTGVNSGAPYNALWSTTFSDSASYLYAGVAYWANSQSIRPDKPLARVRTYVIDVDEGGNGSLVRNRAMYLAGKYGGFADIGADQSPSTGEGNPFKTYVSGTLTTSDGEWLAADGSTSPSGYFLASQPERLLLAIRQIFAQASKPSGNLAGGSLSVSRLSRAQQSGAFYQSQINSTDWSGTVIRTEVTFNTTTLKLESNATPVWDAANLLTGVQSGTTTLNPFPLPANRNIVSYSATSRSGITFTWASIDTLVQASLKTDPSTAILETATDGQSRLDYIRGVRTAETDTTLNYRARSLIMGDSINSAPVLKGKPSSDILDSSYQTFYSLNASRTPTVYVGSNDGMLHAFRAAESKTDVDNGKEIFAYVPRAISLKLNKLTDPGYVKEAYVDGSLSVSEARIYKYGTASPSIDWGSVLVSSMGGGAKGLFALDVTSPTTFNPNNVLWEFTNADDADIGNLLAEPKIVKLAVAGNGNATPDYRWFAMVTSGYNNYSTSTGGGANDKQFLFLISLEKAPGDAWVLGTNYFKIQADNSAYAAAYDGATGLGMPGVATGINGNALFAYAGDLQGNLWRFDLRGDKNTWTGSSKAKVLFIAKNSAGTATQPITVIPSVTFNVVGGYQVNFGTGKFTEPSDGLNASAAQQTLYGIWDSDDGNTFQRIPTGTGSPLSINGLISRTLTVTSGTATVSITGNPFSYGLSKVVGSGQYRGWFADFTSTMERVAVDPSVDSGLMAVNSTIPGGDPCVTNGASNQYRFNPSTGITFVTTGSGNTQGYLGSASLLEVGDTAWSARNSSGRYVVTRKINSISPGVGGGLSTQESTVTSIAGRISWREITNFQ